ncbi:MAG: hypothetical protein BGN97_04450 [Microbacterium sp. 69-10]|uniref:DUF6019 family protein n=1 Tax=Microbacterium sp. 69-10 TaxID=1895783 RepID=UPI0009638EC1|nr:DUF6019 family protein [Microbacterium sp. 69-10]OJU42012.1 MAG: hypothetical protein BGN97_04450 [Microbacterium sp. 69-10]
MSIDFAPIIIAIAVSTIVGLILLYFVIKSAVKNALIEDRRFQARVAEEVRRAEAGRAAQSS